MYNLVGVQHLVTEFVKHIKINWKRNVDKINMFVFMVFSFNFCCIFGIKSHFTLLVILLRKFRNIFNRYLRSLTILLRLYCFSQSSYDRRCRAAVLLPGRLRF